MGWIILELMVRLAIKVFELIIKGLELLIKASERLATILKRKSEMKEEQL
jgi:hypothetical protein